jgi:hypothetical protein
VVLDRLTDTVGPFCATLMASNVVVVLSHSPVEARELLEVDSWLRTIESKFGLLHGTMNQMTMFTAQQLLGTAGAWWANFIATHLANQMQWAKFHKAFRTQHI